MAKLSGSFQRGDLQPFLLGGLALAATVALIGALAWSLDLAPPRSLGMAAGRPGGGYHAIAERYRAILAEDGIDLAILESAGSVENARLLAEGRADVALLQGGVAVPGGAEVEALAAVFLEPLLIFHRNEVDGRSTPSPGPSSASPPASLAAGRVRRCWRRPGRLPFRWRPEAAADRRGGCRRGAARRTRGRRGFRGPRDCAVPRAAVRQRRGRYRADPRRRGAGSPAALCAHGRYPAGGPGLCAAHPAERVPLVAMVASLVARDDLHPALVNRLVRAAERIHAGTDLVTVQPVFPSTDGLKLPVNAQAAAALADGPDAFERVLPYWMSAQVSRFALLLVPIIVLLLPLFRLLPGVYAWRMHSRIYRRYQELMTIEREAESGIAPARLDELLARLERIDADARSVRVRRATANTPIRCACTSTWSAASWRSRPQASEAGGDPGRSGEDKALG